MVLPEFVAIGVVAALGVLALAVLTGQGARRRGASVPLACVEALLFPLAWVAWYVRDDEAGARRSRRLAERPRGLGRPL